MKAIVKNASGSLVGGGKGERDFRLTLLTLRLGGVLIVLSNAVWLIMDLRAPQGPPAAVLPLHWFNIGLGFALILATGPQRLAIHWRGVLWITWLLMFASCSIISERTSAADSLAMILAMTLVCNALCLKCSRRWLGSLSALAIAWFAWLSLRQPVTALEWFFVLAGVAISHFGQEILLQHRRQSARAWALLQDKLAELEAAERRARQNEETLRRILEFAPGAIAVTRYADGRFISINREVTAADLTGDSLIGRTPLELDLFCDRQAYKHCMRRLGAEGVVRNVEFDLRRQGGEVVRFLLSFILVELDGEKCVVALGHDVTEARETERRLRESEKSLRQLIDACPEPITIARLTDHKFIAVNSAASELSGYAREEMLGRSAAELGFLVSAAENREFMRRLQADGVVRNMEMKIRLRRGELRDYLVSAALVQLGAERGLLVSNRDITEIKEAQAELVRAREAALAASHAKSEFLSSMSHEIRTPMNAVLGMAELLAESELNVEQRRFLDVMIANGNSLLELINSILDLAKIESGRMQMEEAEFDLSELIDRTISTFGVRAHAKGIELIARIGSGVADHLIGDPLRLRQVLVNLVGNAIKFTTAGEIVLAVEKSDETEQPGALLFKLSDTGIGIAHDKLEMIFSSFTQGDSSTTRQYGGSGLGLAIVQRLVGLMGGRIWVESEPGRGSTFFFTVRLRVAARVMKPRPDILPDLSGFRVLVVDDHANNRLVVREIVASRGAKVTEVESGPEALEAVRQAACEGRPYHIVLLDMRMPGMDGLEVAQRIRGAHFPVQPLILMLSSDDLTPQLSRLREARLAAYMVKPITRRELFEAIERVIGTSSPAGAVISPPPRKLPPVSILVAEDSPDNRLVLSAYLRGQPCSLDFAEDGIVAVQKFMAHRYDLVFMDIQMPRLDGFAATRQIRQWEADQGYPPTPIIALTGSAFEEAVRRTKEAGCDAHLAKPVSKAAILDAIHEYGKGNPAAARPARQLSLAGNP